MFVVFRVENHRIRALVNRKTILSWLLTTFFCLGSFCEQPNLRTDGKPNQLDQRTRAYEYQELRLTKKVLTCVLLRTDARSQVKFYLPLAVL